MIIKKRDGLMILTALGLRIFLSAITFHPDLLFVWSVPGLFTRGVVNYFEYVGQYKPEALQTKYPVYYPPISYVFTGIWLNLAKYLSPNLISWLDQARSNLLSPTDIDVEEILSITTLTELRWNLILIKSSYVLVDFLIAAIIYKTVASRKLLAVSIYLFNPITLFSVYMLGQIDNLTLLLVLLFLYLAVKSPKLSLIPLAVSAGIKTLPMFFFVPFSLIISRNFRNALTNLMLVIAIFTLINLPWAINSFEPLLKSYFPPFISPWPQLAFRPDSLWGIFRIAAAAAVGIYLVALYVKSEKIINRRRIIYLVTAIVCLIFSAYSAVKLNYYVILMGLLALVWMERPHVVAKTAIFSLLWMLAFIYARPLMGEMLSPILGWEKAASLPSHRDLINPIFKYEHLGLLARMILDVWILSEAWRYGKMGLKLKISAGAIK